MYEVVPTIKKIPETKILYSFHLKYIYTRLLHLQNMCMFKYAGEKKITQFSLLCFVSKELLYIFYRLRQQTLWINRKKA